MLTKSQIKLDLFLYIFAEEKEHIETDDDHVSETGKFHLRRICIRMLSKSQINLFLFIISEENVDNKSEGDGQL